MHEVKMSLNTPSQTAEDPIEASLQIPAEDILDCTTMKLLAKQLKNSQGEHEAGIACLSR